MSRFLKVATNACTSFGQCSSGLTEQTVPLVAPSGGRAMPAAAEDSGNVEEWLEAATYSRIPLDSDLNRSAYLAAEAVASSVWNSSTSLAPDVNPPAAQALNETGTKGAAAGSARATSEADWERDRFSVSAERRTESVTSLLAAASQASAHHGEGARYVAPFTVYSRECKHSPAGSSIVGCGRRKEGQ